MSSPAPDTPARLALAAEQRRAERETYLERLEMERFTMSGISRAEYVELLRFEQRLGRQAS